MTTGLSAEPQTRTNFILANTSVLSPPHVPEIRLHLADEAHELWQKTEAELEAIGLPPPFWAFAWAGGQGLARHVLDRPEAVRGARVLDLASGCGLVAIAALRAGAAHVTANDVDPFCAAAIALNSELNGVAPAFDGRDLVGAPQLAADHDVILAGDVFYDRELSGRLLPFLAALRAGGKAVLIGDPGRAYLPRHGLRLLSEHRVPVSRALEDSEVKRTLVWELTG